MERDYPLIPVDLKLNDEHINSLRIPTKWTRQVYWWINKITIRTHPTWNWIISSFCICQTSWMRLSVWWKWIQKMLKWPGKPIFTLAFICLWLLIMFNGWLIFNFNNYFAYLYQVLVLYQLQPSRALFEPYSDDSVILRGSYQRQSMWGENWFKWHSIHGIRDHVIGVSFFLGVGCPLLLFR